MESVIPPEILFAQHLAANEKVKRDRALRKLQKYFFNHSSLPTGGFNETELLKIWKGLHYCMWMQDKPLVQEDLSSSIASLIHSFNNTKTALMFIKTFYITECREWTSIDKWRIDKFMMLFRNVLTQSFEFLKKNDWKDNLTKEFLQFMSELIILDHNHDMSPDGVRFHLAFTFLPELENVSAGKLGPKQIVAFILPWINMLAGVKCKTLRDSVIKNIFGEIIQQSTVMTGRPRKKDSTKLRVSYSLVADKLLEVGSSDACLTMNRPAIYSLVQNFRDIAQGKLPYSPEDEVEEEVENDDDIDDIESAVERLMEFDESIKDKNGKRRKRKRQLEDEIIDQDEAYASRSSDSDDEENSLDLLQYSNKQQDDSNPDDTVESSEAPLKKRRKAKRKKNEDSSAAVEKMVETKTAENGTEDISGGKSSDTGDLTNKKLKNKTKDKKKESVGKKVAEQHDKTKIESSDFDLEDFPQSDAPDISTLVSPAVACSTDRPQPKNKKRAKSKRDSQTEKDQVVSSVSPAEQLVEKNKQSKRDDLKKSAAIANFTPTNTAKAKYFKKAMSKSASTLSSVSPSSKEESNTQKKRISFGKSKAVAKNAVKLKGRLSYDPSKTPEQGILRVNPIKPGTVIEVGKQATLRNTLKNSKFPNRMVSSDFF